MPYPAAAALDNNGFSSQEGSCSYIVVEGTIAGVPFGKLMNQREYRGQRHYYVLISFYDEVKPMMAVSSTVVVEPGVAL